MKEKRRHMFRGIVILLMLVIIGILLWMQFGPQKEEEDTLTASVKAQLGQLEGKSEAEVQAELDRIVEEGMFHITINPDPVFADGASEGNLEIENTPNNLYGMLVQIVLADSGELVYDSGLIYPNYHIQSDELLVELAAGEYAAVASFTAYDLETYAEVGVVSSEITLHILS